MGKKKRGSGGRRTRKRRATKYNQLDERRAARSVRQALERLPAPQDPSRGPFDVTPEMIGKFRHEQAADIKAAMLLRGLSRDDIVRRSGLSRAEVDDVLDCLGEGYMEDLAAVSAAAGHELKLRKRMTLAEARDAFASALEDATSVDPAITAALRRAETPESFEELSAIFGDPSAPRPAQDEAEQLTRWGLAYTFNNIATCLRRGQPAFAEEIMAMMTGVVREDETYKTLPLVPVPESLAKRYLMHVVPAPEAVAESAEALAAKEAHARILAACDDDADPIDCYVVAVRTVFQELGATDERVVSDAEIVKRVGGDRSLARSALDKLIAGNCLLAFPGGYYSTPLEVRAGPKLVPLRGQERLELVSAVDGSPRGQHVFEFVPKVEIEPERVEVTPPQAAPMTPQKLKSVRAVLDRAEAYDGRVVTRAEVLDHLIDATEGARELDWLVKGNSIVAFPGGFYSKPLTIRAGSPPSPRDRGVAKIDLRSALDGRDLGVFRFRVEEDAEEAL